MSSYASFLASSVAVTCGLEKVTLPFIDRGTAVEYELIRSLGTVTQEKRKRVGVVATDAQVFGRMNPMNPGSGGNWTIANNEVLVFDAPTRADGNWTPWISADGRYVVFYSDSSNLVSGDTNGANDVFLHDMQTGTTSRISVSSSGTAGNSESFFPSISADGRYVVFTSAATNLVSGDTNGIEDVFVRDLQAGTTTIP